MNTDRYYKLISKYLANEASDEEVQLLKGWTLQNRENQMFFEDIQKIWKETRFKDKFGNQEAVLKRILAGINNEQRQPAERPRYQPWRNLTLRYIAAAVIAIVIVSAAVLIQINLSGGEHSAVSAVERIIKTNPVGQKSKIFLPDGSSVWLNAESQVWYNSNFGDSTRDIWLKGEAYFEVAKDSTPFSVKANGLTITALGTSFNVTAYPREDATTIALLTGKLGIRKGSMNEILTPNQLLVYENSSNVFFKENVDAGEWSAWKDGTLIFKAEPVETVIKKLERWYGLDIKVAGTPDEQMKFTGKFTNEYLNNILESMSYGRDFTYTINNKSVELNFNKTMKDP